MIGQGCTTKISLVSPKLGLMKTMKAYLILLLSITLFSCVLNAQQPTNITLQLKWKHQFQFAGYYAAIEKGYYKELGINVNLAEAVEGQNPSNAVFNGKAEFGVCTSDIVLMRGANKKAVVLATIFQHSPQILLASKQAGIDHIHNLVGKKIALEPNAADIIAFMDSEGVSLDECIVNEHTFSADLLMNGKLDAISAYSTDEPFELQQANFEYTIIAPAMGGIDFYGDVLFTTEDLIEKDPTLVKNFRKASLKGWKYAMEHPEEVIGWIYTKYSKRHSIEHLRFEAEHMKKLIMADVVELGYTNPGRWLTISETYKELDMLPASFTNKGLLYSEYEEPVTKIPWKLIALFLIIIAIIGSATYFYYKALSNLKKEIAIRSRIEKDLVDSEEKHRILFLNSPDAYLIIVDGVFSDCNKAAELMLGGNRSQIVGNSPSIISPEFQPDGKRSTDAADQKVKEALLQGNNCFEWLHRRFDGSDLHVEVSIASMTLKEKPALFITWRDISRRRKAEEEKRKGEAIYSAILNASPDAITISDLTGRYIMVSPSAVALAGLNSQDEMIGRNIVEFVAPEDKELVLSNYSLMLKGIKTGPNQYRGLKSSSSVIDIEVNGSTIKDANGQPELLVFSVRDITERKKTESEIKHKNEQLEKLNSEKDKFFSIIAHDLRGPFNGFLGLTQIMAEQLASLTLVELQEISKGMNKSANNLFNLLNNLLEWARMQQGSINFEPKPIDLLTLATSALQPLLDSALKKGIGVNVHIPENIHVFADENMLLSTIRNLASNAIKFTPAGGSVTLSAKNTDAGHIEFSIQDTGIGMDQETLGNMFKLDVSISRKGTEGEPSTGLGLLLCKDFIEKHGGGIWAESAEGKGSVFYFTLPAKASRSST
jgi:PAS domain S-box-containing protein